MKQTLLASLGERLTTLWHRPRALAGLWALRVQRAASYLGPLARDPKRIPAFAAELAHAWQIGGGEGVKSAFKQLPHADAYSAVWTHEYKKSFTPRRLADLQTRIRRMEAPPLISVVMQTSNTLQAAWLRSVASVSSQLYPLWELCVVVDGASIDHGELRMLEESAAADPRIKLFVQEGNAGVARPTRQALDMARGAFVVCVGAGDVLEPQALYRIAECVQRDHPDMVYADAALLSEDGATVVHHIHRPAFSPEYLRACPYIGHLIAFRATLLSGLNGASAHSPPYNWVLRVTEKAGRIAHIPEILCLEQHCAPSTNRSDQTEDMDAWRAMVVQHLARSGEPAQISIGAQSSHCDVRYTLRPGQKVAIIIPTKNHGELVRQCVDSILRTVKHVSYEIVVVDHASDEPATLAYFDLLRQDHQLLRYEGVFNFSRINNWAVSNLRGAFSHYLFCNNDIEAMEDEWLERMVELAQKPDVGVVGAKLLYPDRTTIQHAGVCVGMYGLAEHYAKSMNSTLPDASPHPGYHASLVANHEVSAVTAACALVRRDAFERVGGYDEALAVGFGDVDLCLKICEAGYRVVFCAHAVLVHHESLTRGQGQTFAHPQDSARFAKKWRATLDQGDPYYNTNLTLQGTQWEARRPAYFKPNITARVWQRPAVGANGLAL